MHVISSYRGKTHKTTNTQTNKQDRLEYTVPLASVQCNNGMWQQIYFPRVIFVRGQSVSNMF